MSPLARLGRAAARRARLVVALWMLAGVVAVALAVRSGAPFTDRFTIPGSQSQQATDLLKAKFPQYAGTAVQVVFHADRGTLSDPRSAAALEATLAAIRRQPYVALVTDPLSPDAPTVSRDGTIAYTTVQYTVDAGELAQPGVDRLEAAAATARAAGVQVEFGGELLDFASPLAGSTGEGFGLLVALLILIVAFGSIVAAGLPIATALVALAIGIPIVALVATRVDVSTIAPTVAAMLALGAGIDYALFISTRFREQLRAGHDVGESVAIAVATSGRAVLFAGSTVVVSILALWLSGLPFAGWLGTAAAITVATTVLAAVTLLPAILALVGHNIDRLRLPALRRRREPTDADSPTTGSWARWGRRVVDRPWPYLLASLAVLLVLAAPALSLRLGQPDQGSESVTTTQRRAYDLLAQAFGPGVNGPLLVAVELPRDDGSELLARLETGIAADPGVLAVAPPMLNAQGDAAVIAVIPKTAPQAPATQQLLDRLVDQILPAATAGSGAMVHITGMTATYLDLDAKAAAALPVVFGSVILLAFVLLLLAFRSVVVAATAAVLNLLSLGAAFGVVVAVFQWGWGLKLVGLDEAVPMASFVPLMLFAILFGLSMDYEVFLLSRVREAHSAGVDTRNAVVGAIASTARVITSAALIMIAVFLSFVPVEMSDVKMLAVGLATAVLVDATLVRVVLLPATMAILGHRNWWLPRWLERRLPHLALEDASAGAVSR